MFVILLTTEPLCDVMWSQYLKRVSRSGQRSPDLEASITALLGNIPADSSPFERVVVYLANYGSHSLH